jgi:hypothetical protein
MGTLSLAAEHVRGRPDVLDDPSLAPRARQFDGRHADVALGRKVPRLPRLADKTLVPREKIDFPAIAGLQSPLNIPAGYRADLEGRAHPLPLLVPQVDRDGNELSGIRLPNVAVPLATYTGWNFRNPSIGQPGELLPLTGSYIPFPVTKMAREQARDPRLSIEERYGSRAQYQLLVTDAATRLVQEGYLLNEDVESVVQRALTSWDELARGTPLAGN